jgi:hypothetical protein
VDAGTRLVSDAGSTMGELVAQVNRVSDIIGEISASTAEQSQHLNGVSQSMEQLDQMSQSNAALVEEGAAAAESLKEQAVKLHQLVRRYRVDVSAEPVRTAAVLPPSPPVTAAVPAPSVRVSPPPPKAAPAPRASLPPAPAPAALKTPAPAAAKAPAAAPAPAPALAGGDDSDWETF